MSKINFHCTYTAMTADPLMADATYINVLPSPALRRTSAAFGVQNRILTLPDRPYIETP